MVDLKWALLHPVSWWKHARPRPYQWIASKIQRARRGWSDKDVWSFDLFLSSVIAGGLTRLRDHGHSYAPDFESPEAWAAKLTEIIDALEKYAEDEWDADDPDADYNRAVLAMHEVARYFGSFWD